VPHGCREGHLIRRSRHGGVSLVDYRCSFVDSSKLNSLRAVWVASFVWSTTVGTTNWWMGAGGTLSASWKGAWVLSSLMRFSTDSTAEVILAEGSRVPISLTLATLNTPSE
jgi:hypothetical protein